MEWKVRKMKYAYVINHRGRAISIEEKFLQDHINAGFKQISEPQFKIQKYYPEFDKGQDTRFETKIRLDKAPSQKGKKRTYFKATVV